MIAIPSHPCLPCDPAREAPMTYGELDRDNVATCSLRVRWGTGERAPGCGARIALCHGCGLRTRVNGAPCKACGGDEKPEVHHAHCQAVGTSIERLESHPEEARWVAAESADVSQVASHHDGRSRQGDAGPRRETKAKAPSKPRASQKRVAKGKAAPDGPELPFMK